MRGTKGRQVSGAQPLGADTGHLPERLPPIPCPLPSPEIFDLYSTRQGSRLTVGPHPRRLFQPISEHQALPTSGHKRDLVPSFTQPPFTHAYSVWATGGGSVGTTGTRTGMMPICPYDSIKLAKQTV